MTFSTGDKVLIACAGRQVPGEILLAAPNGKSLIVTFEAILDGYLGCMPVMVCDDGSMCSLMTRSPVLLTERPGQ